MKVGSLFSGGGLGDLGFMMAGMEIGFQVEINEYCQNILKLRWPDVPKWRDIKHVKGSELPAVDIITGGFPCQSFSVAGQRRGKEDDRYLWPEMFRIIREVRPRWVVGENVPGIIGIALDDVLSDLEAEGYETATLVFPAHVVPPQVPHRRDRVWIIAESCGTRAGVEEHRSSSQGWEPTDSSESEVLRQEDRKAGPEGIVSSGNDVADPGRIGQAEHEKQTAGLEQFGEESALAYTRRKHGEGEAITGETFAAPQKGNALESQRAVERDRVGDTSDADCSGCQEQRRTKPSRPEHPAPEFSGWREAESGIRRVVDGSPNRVERLKLLGNGQVMAVTAWIGQRIMEYESGLNTEAIKP